MLARRDPEQFLVAELVRLVGHGTVFAPCTALCSNTPQRNLE